MDKRATWLSALSVVGSILASTYQLAAMHRQDTKQEALVASLMGSMQDEQKYLRDELHQLHAELLETKLQVNELEETIAKLEVQRLAQKPVKALMGSGGDVAPSKAAASVEKLLRMDDEIVPPEGPSFAEMRSQAAQGKVWRSGEWCDF